MNQMPLLNIYFRLSRSYLFTSASVRAVPVHTIHTAPTELRVWTEPSVSYRNRTAITFLMYGFRAGARALCIRYSVKIAKVNDDGT